MKISYKKLELYSMIFIYFPITIFLLGWLRLSIAILGMIFLTYIFYKLYYKNNLDITENIFIRKKILFLILLIIIIWLVASGIGGFCVQSGDWSKHNAILHDLINYKWPVYYAQKESGNALLSYYILYYLFPALIGKIGGFRLAEIVLLIQSIIGIFILYLHLCYFLKLKNKYKQLLILILFIVFGGIVLVGKIMYGMIHTTEVSQSFHWFNDNIRIQYSTNIVLIRWVFPQCIVPWIATILFLENLNKIEDFAWVGIPILLYSSFAFVGLVGFYFIMIFYYLLKRKNIINWIKKIFSLQNLYAICYIFPIFLLYLSGNIFQNKPDINNFHMISYEGNWSLYVLFCFSNFGIFSLLVLKDEYKNIVFYIANIILLVLPLFWYGAWNDLCMRASTPALFIISILFFKQFLNMKFEKKKMLKNIIFIGVICIAAYPSVNELYQNAKFISISGRYRNDGWKTLEKQLVRDGTNDEIAYNYVSYDCDNSFFVKYVARRIK